MRRVIIASDLVKEQSVYGHHAELKADRVLNSTVRTCAGLFR